MQIRYWLHALTPVHLGAGRGLGYIDMPVAREKVTNWPYIPGSSVKGVIADYWNASEDNRKKEEYKDLKAAFGTKGSDDNCAAGALVFTDANILCLPVRSFYGTFAWITSPFCLRRMNMNINLPTFPAKIEALVPDSSILTGQENKIYLEDLDIDTQKNNHVTKIADEISKSVFAENPDWQDIFKARFAIVNDDIFTFLCESGTEVSAHIRINEETGIVQGGALWYEEALPVETILTGQVWCDKVFFKASGLSNKDLLERFCHKDLNIQIGGKASTGKGQVRCIFEKAGE